MHSKNWIAATAWFALVAPVARPAFAQAPQQPATPAQALEQEFKALEDRFEAAQEAFYNEMDQLFESHDEKTATAEQQAEFQKKTNELRARDPVTKFVPEFVAFAERAKGTEPAAKAWLQVVRMDRGDRSDAQSPGRRALERLLADHITSPSIAPLAQTLAYMSWSVGRPTCLESLRKMKKESPHAPVKAAATFALASLLMDGESQDDMAQAREVLVELGRDFGTVRVDQRDETYGQLAERNLFELDHLQVGMQAPDFEAVDQDGAKFKLSDYRGKVVVVDFWGFW